MQFTNFLFMDSLLSWLEKGSFIRLVFTWFLRLLTVVLGLIAVGLFFSNWSYFPDLNFLGMIGLVIVQVIYVFLIYMFLHTMIIRSSDISQLETDKYTVIPIFSIIAKLIGELGLISAVMGGLMAAVMRLFMTAQNRMGIAGDFIRSFMSSGGARAGRAAGEGSAITSAFSTFLIGILIGFFLILFYYLISEIIIVIVDIAESLTEKEES